ncbi:TetR/AcrR family transcriptional regulator [Enterococcus sp. 669A]|uniref:TetR/AcrR family transcriptional regulator n=1 Tax=Candidatus Enterococcus moelleringii TaxID=2815325 RepID=A0ABS3L4Q0_9ENTE|nr:TetR/AcrR family transcriptional regulator [Enterococcus sp. 669A]
MFLHTSDKILEESLTLFSIHGFQGVSVEMIANAVGINAGSIYNHYDNKQSILDAIFVMMKERYLEREHYLKIPKNPEQVDDFFRHINLSHLDLISEELFLFYLEDEIEVRFRHLLIIEQFQNPQIAQLLYQRYYAEPIAFQTKLFQTMMDSGLIKEGNAKTAALHFYAPMMLLLTSYERGSITKEEAFNEIREHVQQFRELYSKE